MNYREILEKQLDREWKDHFQTREQSWKVFQLQVIIVGALLGLNLTNAVREFSIITGIFLIIYSIFGFLLNIRHLKAQNRIFSNIQSLEKKLRISLVIDGHKPDNWKWWHIFTPRLDFAPNLMLQVHFVVGLLGIIYVIGKFSFLI